MIRDFYPVRWSNTSFFFAKLVLMFSTQLQAVCLIALEEAANMALLNHEFSASFSECAPSAKYKYLTTNLFGGASGTKVPIQLHFISLLCVKENNFLEGN